MLGSRSEYSESVNDERLGAVMVILLVGTMFASHSCQVGRIIYRLFNAENCASSMLLPPQNKLRCFMRCALLRTSGRRGEDSESALPGGIKLRLIVKSSKESPECSRMPLKTFVKDEEGSLFLGWIRALDQKTLCY
jgi:hypothetical protein